MGLMLHAGTHVVPSGLPEFTCADLNFDANFLFHFGLLPIRTMGCTVSMQFEFALNQ